VLEILILTVDRTQKGQPVKAALFQFNS